MQGSLLKRFWGKVAMGEGCWIWSGSTNGIGYGKMFIDGKTVSAHRVAYELFIGPIPEGGRVFLTCHKGRLGCVSPAHLKLVERKTRP
jgi:hypothetical protein